MDMRHGGDLLMVFCGESIITEISVYVSFYMSEFIIQSTLNIDFLSRKKWTFVRQPYIIRTILYDNV